VKNIFKYLIFDKRNLFILGLINALVSLLDLIGFGSLFAIIGQKLSGEERVFSLLSIELSSNFLLVVMSFTIVVRVFASYVLNYKIVDFAYGVRTKLRLDLFKSLMLTDIETYSKRKVSDDIFVLHDVVHHFINNFVVPLFKIVADAVVIIVLGASIAYLYGMVVLGVFSIIAIVAIILLKVLSEVTKNVGVDSNSSAIIALDLIKRSLLDYRYIKVKKILDKVSYHLFFWSNRYADAKIKEIKILSMPKYLFELILVASLVVSFLLIVLNDIDPAELGAYGLAILYLFVRLMGPAASVMRNAQLINIGRDSFGRIESMLELSSNQSTKKNIKTIADNNKLAISVENLNFSYDKDLLYSEDINFELDKGRWLGIYGKSGSGKSTLLDILLILRPLHYGKLKISQQILDSFSRGSVGYLSQESSFFDDNASLVVTGIPFDDLNDNDRERFDQALLLSNIREEIISRSGNIGVNGAELSGGQKQRLALARALYQAESILILDEPSSALDQETSQIVMRNIKQYYPELTVVVVTHDKELIKFFDQVLKL
jgi:ABC-type bacteriocin/lantibiotic exporter with double-glycine peptidase domain